MSPDAPFQVILNPAASGGRGSRLLGPVRRGLEERELPFRLRVTEGPGHAHVLAREAAAVAGQRRILVVGGDGTVHEVANGILATDVGQTALSVMPVGTGNDFFRMVADSRDLDHALDTFHQGEVRRFEVGRVRFEGGESHFVNLLGVGLDVEVLRRRSNFHRLTGLPQYLAALTATVVSFKPPAFRVEFPDEDRALEGPLMLAVLTVGPSIGGGFFLNPEASPFDGLLDFCSVDALGLWKVARYVPRVLRGTHQAIPEFHLQRSGRFRFTRPDGRPFYFELDGELMPEQTTFLDVEVRVDALPVVMPGEVGNP